MIEVKEHKAKVEKSQHTELSKLIELCNLTHAQNLRALALWRKQSLFLKV